MDELIAKLDAEIATLTAELDAVEASVAGKRQQLSRMQAAKVALRGQSVQHRNRHTPPAKRPGLTTIRIAHLLRNSDMTAKDIKAALKLSDCCVYNALNGRAGYFPGWFAKVPGTTTYRLTELGRASITTEAA